MAVNRRFFLVIFVPTLLVSIRSYSNSLRFLVMGDWGTQTSASGRRLEGTMIGTTRNLQNGGQNNNKNQNQNNNKNSDGPYWSVLVADAMANYANAYHPEFLIALGDNFYNNGVSSVYDELWTTLYMNVYYHDSLQIPWYALLGNHDYGSNKGGGSVSAQIEFNEETMYSKQRRWHAGHCYLESFNVPNEDGSPSDVNLDIVFIDSTLIAPEETYQTSTASGISTDDQMYHQQEQLNCMEHYLSQSNAHYLLVAGHYPVFSTGKNGPGDMESMVSTVLPLLEKYNVDAYLCGHDHFLEHLTYHTGNGNNMDFVISGAAGKPDRYLYSGISSRATMQFAAATGGFAFADVTVEGMTIKYVDYNGNELYSTYRPQSRVVMGQEQSSSSGGSRGSNGGSSSQSVWSQWLSPQDNQQDGTLINGDKQQQSNDNNILTSSQTETIGQKSYQIAQHVVHTFGIMNTTEAVEISILCGILMILVVMIFVVTHPKFNGSEARKRRLHSLNNTMDLPSTADKKQKPDNWRVFIRQALSSRPKTPIIPSENTRNKENTKPQRSFRDALEDARSASSAGASHSSAHSLSQSNMEMKIDTQIDLNLDSTLTRKQFYAARREALMRTRTDRRRGHPSHPVLMPRNLHDALDRSDAPISRATADFIV